MKRTRILALGTVATLLVAAMTQGCSDDSGDDGGSSSAGKGGSSAGSGGSSAGTGGSSAGTGGSSAGTGGSSAGTGGSSAGTGGSAGGTAGTGGGSAGTDGGSGTCPTGIRSNPPTACTASCTGSVCGLSDLGRRNCACTAGFYACDACAFTGNESVLQPPTSPLAACTTPEATLKGSPCMQSEQGMRCQPATAANVCACWNLEWDCDKKPTNWPM